MASPGTSPRSGMWIATGARANSGSAARTAMAANTSATIAHRQWWNLLIILKLRPGHQLGRVGGVQGSARFGLARRQFGKRQKVLIPSPFPGGWIVNVLGCPPGRVGASAVP